MNNNPNAQKTTTASFIEQLELLQKVHAEARARITPEQRAEEQRQLEARRQAIAHKKAESHHRKLTELYGIWCKRDTWLIESQAMHLLAEREPTEITIFDGIDQELLALVKSCAGHSLQVINPAEKPGRWLVKPPEWVRWLKEKGYSVPKELTNILFPKPQEVTPQQKIAPAQDARERKKRDRQKALKAFMIDITDRARLKSITVDIQSIPVTKADFLQVFYRQYPQIDKISPTTFDHDIADIGIKFKHGTKSNKNNILMQLFN